MQTNVSDINNLAIRFAVPIVGSVAAAWATVWLLQTVNPLAAFCFVATLIMVQVAIVSPRVGLVLLLGLCAYSDLIKRLLVIFGDLNFDQVSYVLMAAPAMVVGLLLSLVTQRAFHHLEFRRSDFFLGGVAVVLALSNFLLSKKFGGSFLEASKEAVNHGVYAGLAMVGIRILEGEQQIEKFLRLVLLIFLPVAIYGLWQLYFGFADFEVDYLRSGLTMEMKQLLELRPRPFSTLNSASVLGTLSAGLAVLALYPRLAIRHRPYRSGEAVGSLALALLFLAMATGSLVRSSHIVWIVAAIGLLCFRTRRGTLFFYGTGVVSFLVLVLSAGFLLDHLLEIDPAQLVQSDYAQSVLSILTYSERLKGFVNLTSSWDMYSLFGLPEEKRMTETTYNHDPVSTILTDHGVVGLLVVVVTVTLMVTWLHRRLLLMPLGRERMLAVLLMSVLMGWLASELLVKAVITTFPLNALFWLLVGALGRLVLYTKNAPAESEGDSSSPLPATLPASAAWARDVSQERTGKQASRAESGGSRRFQK